MRCHLSLGSGCRCWRDEPFLLPDGPSSRNDVSSFGANAMELLINGLARSGAVRGRLRAKVFGGAEMYKGLTNAGTENGCLFCLT